MPVIVSQKNQPFELVYAKKGTKQDYDQLNVEGKLVLIDLDTYIGCQIGICALQAKQKGASGIIAIPVNEDKELPDDALIYENFTAPADIPAFSMSLKDGKVLKEIVAQSANDCYPCYLKLFE